MSRHDADSDDSSNDGSGTDSEEDQKADEGSSRSESSSESESESETEDTQSRFMVLKNEVGDKRARDDTGSVDPGNKKPKTLGGRPLTAGNKSDSQSKASPAPRAVSTPNKPPLKKSSDVKKPVEPEKQATKKKESENTPKKSPQAWTSDEEYILIAHILKDMKTGIKPPKRGSRGENYHYWGDLHDACQGKFITEWSKEQLYDKYRRMKSRFDGMVRSERTEGINALKFKNPGEEKVYNLWKQIYEMQEQEEPEPPPSVPKLDNKKLKTPPPSSQKSKDSSHEEETKKDTPSSSKKAKLISRPKDDQPKQNGSLSTQNNNPSMAALQELQKRSNAALEDMQGKMDQIMNDFQVRSQNMIQEMVKGAGGKVEWLNEWLMLSMARSNSPFLSMEMPQMMGGLGTGVLGWFGGWDGSSPAAMKLKEHWLKQQEEELRVMEQRLRLMQDLCHHQQEILKKQAR